MKLAVLAMGIWDSIHVNILEQFVQQGHEVVVYTESDRAASGQSFTGIVEGDIRYYAISDKRRNPWLWLPDRLLKPWFGRRFFTRLWAMYRFLRAHRDADLVVVEGDFEGVWVALCQKWLRFKWVVGVHDLGFLKTRLYYPGQPTSTFRERLKRWVLRSADGVRSNSVVTTQVLLEGGAPAATLKTIPLHLAHWMLVDDIPDLAIFRQQAREKLIAHYPQIGTQPVLMSMSRVAPVKGLELAIDTLAGLQRQGVTAYLLICGGDRVFAELGSTIEALKQHAASQGVAEYSIFPGEIPKEEVRWWLASADLNIAPSWIDTFNLAAAESAVLGVPSLMSDKVGIAPILTELGIGRVVADRELSSWTSAALASLRPAAYPEAQRQQAAQQLSQQLSIAAVSHAQIEWYKALAGQA